MSFPGSTHVPSPTGPVLRRLVAAGTAVLLLGGVAACGGDDDPGSTASSPTSQDPSASPSDDPTASPSEEPSEEPTASPTEEPTASTSPTASPTSGSGGGSGDGGGSGALRDDLLAASAVPGLNAESSWTQGRTGPVGSESFGWCSRFDALTIGARDGVQRDFTSGGDRAGQQVLDFVDATNARRAEQVFRGWHRDCQSRSSIQVGPIRQLSATGGGTAWWYLSNRPGGEGSWEAFGLAMSGSRVTVLRMEHTGQDHSYAPGQDPLERAVLAAAAKLG